LKVEVYRVLDWLMIYFQISERNVDCFEQLLFREKRLFCVRDKEPSKWSEIAWELIKKYGKVINTHYSKRIQTEEHIVYDIPDEIYELIKILQYIGNHGFPFILPDNLPNRSLEEIEEVLRSIKRYLTARRFARILRHSFWRDS